jgi:DNA-binding Lrp family transcriptional regulator
MSKVPSEVAKVFGKLREESKSKIYLKAIGGRYYVYKESGRWDKEKKKTIVKSEYLGRILDNGTYVKKIAAYGDELERAKALILEKGGNITWPERKEGTEAVQLSNQAPVEAGEIDTKLLMALSMNARASFAHIGKLVGLSPSATYARVKNLEKRYGIRYTAEIDLDKLGYTTHLILIKFQTEIPSMENLKEAVKKDPRIQLAFLTKGEYDLIIFVLTETGEEGRFGLYKQRDTLFTDYDARWYRAPVYFTYNFIPIREEFFELLKAQVWKRTKETPRLPEGRISYGEYCVLYELVKNGVMDFSEIDRKYGFDRGMAQYTYHRLKEKQIIRRITMSMSNLPIKYLAVQYLENTNDKNWVEAKPKLLAHIIKETIRPTDYCALVGDAGTPNGSIFVIPLFSDEDLEKAEEELRSTIKNPKVTTSIVVSTLVNSLCFRKFDRTQSTQYNRLVDNYGFKNQPVIKYE